MPAAVGLPFAQRSGLGRGYIAGAQAVALDVIFAVFRADIAGEHLQAALGCRIGRNRLAAQLAHHRAYINDLTLAALHHLRHYRRRADVRTHQVHVYHLLEFGAAHLVHRYALDDACVVYQDVDGADLGVDLLYQGLHGRLVGDVAHIAVHILYARLTVGLETLEHRGFVAGVENDIVCPRLYKRLGDGKAYAVGSARNPGVLTFKRKETVHTIASLLIQTTPSLS